MRRDVRMQGLVIDMVVGHEPTKFPIMIQAILLESFILRDSVIFVGVGPTTYPILSLALLCFCGKNNGL
jgi:hypothetical protein